jgi:hypothetical protein
MEQHLRQLIEEVCQHPLKNPKRQKAMNKLLIEIQRLPGLGKSSHPDYLDALNQTWEWGNRSICTQFDWSKPKIQERLVQWLNSYLYWRIKDLYSSSKVNSTSLDAPIGNDEAGATLLELLSENGLHPPSRNGLDAYIEQIERERQQDIGLALEQYIEEDPEGKLHNCHPKAHPECNCRLLSQRVLLNSPPNKFSSLSTELNIKYQTLNAHWKRNCLPQLQEIAKELGYQP